MKKHSWRVGIEDYALLIGAEAVERIVLKAQRLRGLRVVNISSTFYGGGVAELLSSTTLLARSVDIRADWRLIQGSPDFFSVTKKFHNALQGAEINFTDLKKEIYEEVVLQNSVRMDLDCDFVIVHDPQPLPLITHYRRNCPWVWRCHIDLSHPNPEVWDYLKQYVEQYDAIIFSLPEYSRELTPPQVFIMPAIDPFSVKNAELSEREIKDRLKHYGIPDDLPIVAQISRYDRWKDPEGVIEAFKIARQEVPATLVLLGNVATDDPEGQEVFESVLKHKEERIHILTVEDSALVNALQRRAAVILQKSLREGFGLTVTEAMWKGTPVIGGRCGGIKHQIEDGVNGFLVSSVREAAKAIVRVLKDQSLRSTIGKAGRESVQERFLMTRELEQHLDLASAFEACFTANRERLAAVSVAATSKSAAKQ
ncbi:MAG TPA: glycosyltransferase [Candidatus Binatia bacterium]|nr:glycosyltransferase [Candidatus Binatia bacterium]